MISHKYVIFGLVVIIIIGLTLFLIFRNKKENHSPAPPVHHFHKKEGISQIEFAEAYRNMTQQERNTRDLSPNFTKKGYIAKKLPRSLKKRLLDLWNKKKHLKKAEAVPHDVIWGTERSTGELLYNLDINHHDTKLKKDLEDYVRGELMQWSGAKNLIHTATFGIREYKRGAALKVHCDRYETHVLSAILHITHQQEKPWPLTVWDHDGNKENVLLDDDTDLVLYESVAVMHGRPYPFEGESYVNLFLHFTTPGWKEKMEKILH